MRHIRISIVFAFLMAFFSNHAIGQDFTEDPQGAIGQSVELAQFAVSEPLVLEGLTSIVVRYNRARAELSPAGYESGEWLQQQIFATIGEVDGKVSGLVADSIQPLPEAEVAEMLEAFTENSESYYSFYETVQQQAGLQDVSANQMLYYLSAYAVVTNSVDSGLWDRFSSFTGVWPLCFWQG